MSSLAAYLPPGNRVFQQITPTPGAVETRLIGAVVGPLAHLARYTQPAERAGTLVGVYAAGDALAAAYPGRPAGGRVDLGYTRVFLERARLRYLDHPADAAIAAAAWDGAADRIRLEADAWATAPGHPRLATLHRDAAPGDRVRVSAPGVAALETYVAAVETDPDDAVVGDPVADGANAATAAADAAVTRAATNSDEDFVPAASAAAYDGAATGDVVETYTVTVTAPVVGGDIATARFRLRSSSGRDDADDVVVGAAGAPAAFGARGLTLTFTAPLDFDVGDSWTVAVTQEYEAIAAVSGGAYAGTAPLTYVVEVVRGGAFGAAGTVSAPPLVRVTTTTGVDATPGLIALRLPHDAVALGSLGATIAFGPEVDGPAVIAAGERFYVAATPASAARRGVLALGHTLSDELIAAEALRVELSLVRDLELPRPRPDDPGLPNWSADADGVTLAAVLRVGDPGAPAVDLPVLEADAFVHYRAWLPGPGDDVFTVGDLDALAELAGPSDPDNPLKYGLLRALGASAGRPVRGLAVRDPEALDSWAEAVGKLQRRADVYGIAPLSFDPAVQQLVVDHAKAWSAPERHRFRIALLGLEARDVIPVSAAATSSDGAPVLATIEADAGAPGTPFTIVRRASDNADWLADGVRAGDVLRTNFRAGDDGTPGEHYDEYVVDLVQNGDTLRLLAGPGAAVDVAQRVEVWHAQSADELVDDLAAQAGQLAHRRVVGVWPDRLGSGGRTVPGYFLAATVAGLLAGVEPHQDLTHYPVPGFDDVSRSDRTLREDQVARLAEHGVFVVVRSDAGVVRVFDAVTTDAADQRHRSLQITTNLDSLSLRYAARVAPFIGVANLTDDTIDDIRQQLEEETILLRGTVVNSRLGAQIDDARVVSIERHSVLLGRLRVRLEADIPPGFRGVDLYVVV